VNGGRNSRGANDGTTKKDTLSLPFRMEEGDTGASCFECRRALKLRSGLETTEISDKRKREEERSLQSVGKKGKEEGEADRSKRKRNRVHVFLEGILWIMKKEDEADENPSGNKSAEEYIKKTRSPVCCAD